MCSSRGDLHETGVTHGEMVTLFSRVTRTPTQAREWLVCRSQATVNLHVNGIYCIASVQKLINMLHINLNMYITESDKIL